jgi:hypothetical protein
MPTGLLVVREEKCIPTAAAVPVVSFHAGMGADNRFTVVNAALVELGAP